MKKVQRTDKQRGTQLLLFCGFIGGLWFILVLLILGAMFEGYRTLGNTGSSLAIGDKGWMQICNFLITGFFMLAFAQGLRRTLSSGFGAKWGPRLFTLFGIGLLGAGIFVTDPEFGYPPGTPPGPAVVTSWHGELHGLFAIITFGSLTCLCFVFMWRFWTQSGTRKWAIYSGIFGLVIGLFIILTFNSSAIGLEHYHGLLQRMILIPGWTWISMLAYKMIEEVRT